MEESSDSSTTFSELFADVPQANKPKQNSKKTNNTREKKSQAKNQKIGKETLKVKPKSVEEKTQNEQTRHLDLPIQAVIKPIETKKIRKIPNLVKDHLKQKSNNKISKSQKQVPKITEGNKV